MKKTIVSGVVLTSLIILSGCSLTNEKEDTMKLEGMMPKEDSKTIDAMMKKTEGEDTMMEKDTMMKDEKMMKEDSAMMKKEVSGYTTYNASAVSDALTAGKKVVLFFHASWCPSCKAADANFIKETPPANTVVFKVDYDSNKALKAKYGVTSQHTFVSLNADETLKKKSSGANSFADLAGLN
jgi:thiol-disulfide isomerase/thioredoxin